jgi:(p)ppGpp synthase/HD superfamily hydrolase
VTPAGRGCEEAGDRPLALDLDAGQLVERLLTGLAPAARALVHDASMLAAELHTGQVRDEGQPYILHPLRVAVHLRLHGCHDPTLLAAALLHDTLEDTPITEAELAARFGPRVAALVWAATKPALRRRRAAAAYLAVAGASEREADLIKLADRLDNLLTLHASPRRGMRLRVLEETRLRYVPHAVERGGSLGAALIAAWQWQLERVQREGDG